MNYKLIMLPNPILVSDEEITKLDRFVYDSDLKKVVENTDLKTLTSFKSKCDYYHKIIGNVEELPKLDLSAIEEEIGNEKKYSEKDIIDFYEWCDISDEAARFWRLKRVYPSMDGSHNSLLRQRRIELFQIWVTKRKPKEYNVEVEMEYYYMSSKKFYGNDADWIKCSKDTFDSIKREIPSCPLKIEPKLTNNTIKIIKLCKDN